MNVTAEQANEVVRGCIMYLQAAGILIPKTDGFSDADLIAANFQIKHFAEGYRAAINRLTALLSDPLVAVPNDISELDNL